MPNAPLPTTPLPATPPPPLYLTLQQQTSFAQNGFLLIPNFIPQSESTLLLEHALLLLSQLDLDTHPKTKFTTDNNDHVGDSYFLDSGDKIRYFFEPAAIDTHGQLLVHDKKKAINKIGHGLHYNDPVFRKFSMQQRLIDISKDICFRDCRILQSMIICKQPGIGASVNNHQDSTFLHTTPQSAVGCWFALEDCDADNGCMWFVPGSHLKYPLVQKRFVRKADGSGTEFIAMSGISIDQPLESEYVCTPTRAGTLVLIHGSVYHRSSHNHSTRSRFIYTFHMIEGENIYDSRNWLQVPGGGALALA